MNDRDRTVVHPDDCRTVRIGLAGPDAVRGRSAGEVKEPGTIDAATGRPVRAGLYCERIFGPVRGRNCACGEGRGGDVCETCGARVGRNRARHRTGHIELASPVVHAWYFCRTNLLAALLGLSPGDLRKVIYHQDWVVTDPGTTSLETGRLLTDGDYDQARARYGDTFRAGTGAAAVRDLLRALDLARLSSELRAGLGAAMSAGASALKVRGFVRRIELVERLRDSENRPEWMVLDCLPVVSPVLRRGTSRQTAGDLDQLYARIIWRSQRVRKLTGLGAPEVVLRNERRMLQQAVDALLDNGRCRSAVRDQSGRLLDSLTDRLKDSPSRTGAGKCVDYSARSVAVPGPELKLHQCGLPVEVALELFRPLVLGWLIRYGAAPVRDRANALARELRPNADSPPNWQLATRHMKDLGPGVWTALAEVMRGRSVLLSRSPVVARAQLRAFEPVLTDGQAVRVHTLVGASMGLNFDGDQVVVHLPLSTEAQLETALLAPPNNLFDPANGAPLLAPSRDVVMGCYYLTANRGAEDDTVEAGDGMTFHSPPELFCAYAEGKLGVHAKIRVRLPVEKTVISDVKDAWGDSCVRELPRAPRGLVRTTVGRVIFNDILHPKMAFYDVPLSSKHLNRILADCYQALGHRETVALLDRIKETGFRESTRSGLSLAVSDLRTPDNKERVLTEKDKDVAREHRNFDRGITTENERHNKVIDLWMEARDLVTKQMVTGLRDDRRNDPVTGKMVPYLNPIYLMAHSGACGGIDQFRRLTGMWGLVTKSNGTIVEVPIKSNFREGLTALEYWSSLPTVRTAAREHLIRAEESAHLMRRLVDLVGDVVVTVPDCGTLEGITQEVIRDGAADRSISEAVSGRVARRGLISAHDDSVAANENSLITDDRARQIERTGMDRFRVRSPMTCQAPSGVCRMCYGADPATGRLVEEGAAVGVFAAHALGAAAAGLIPPAGAVPIGSRGGVDSEVKARRDGIVRFENVQVVTNGRGEQIALVAGHGELRILRGDLLVRERYSVPHGAVLLVGDGAEVIPGTILCRWDPEHELIVATVAGRVEFRSLIPGVTVRALPHFGGQWEVTAHRGDTDPHILVRVAGGRAEAHYLGETTRVEVHDGQEIAVGTVLARRPRVGHWGTTFVGHWGTISGDRRPLLSILEARYPSRVAVPAEVSGVVQIGERIGGRGTIRIQPTEGDAPVGTPVEHRAGAGSLFRVRAGDRVERGDPLTFGDVAPQDLLRFRGRDAVCNHLLREIRDFFRAQRTPLDDRHIEMVVAQMLRNVRVDSPGDTDLLPGTLTTASEVRRVNSRLARTNLGDDVPPVPATATPVLMGLTRAVAFAGNFIAAPALRDRAALLAAAALAGRVSRLTGLKENVVMGRIISAGTGWPGSREAEGRKEVMHAGDRPHTADGTSPHGHAQPTLSSVREDSLAGGPTATPLARVRRALRDVRTPRRIAATHEQRLLARLDALAAARAAALATIRDDDSVEAREAKADVAASICDEIESAKDELNRLCRR